ncbi:hypothetical protein GCM10027418_28460 [Mariniluteicoccus endophyticus]
MSATKIIAGESTGAASPENGAARRPRRVIRVRPSQVKAAQMLLYSGHDSPALRALANARRTSAGR